MIDVPVVGSTALHCLSFTPRPVTSVFITVGYCFQKSYGKQIISFKFFKKENFFGICKEE